MRVPCRWVLFIAGLGRDCEYDGGLKGLGLRLIGREDIKRLFEVSFKTKRGGGRELKRIRRVLEKS